MGEKGNYPLFLTMSKDISIYLFISSIDHEKIKRSIELDMIEGSIDPSALI
jgi:hypothetical protein